MFRNLLALILLVSMLSISVPPAAAQDEQPLVTVRYVDASSPDGLVAYWKFDEDSGATAASFPNVALKANLTTGASFSPAVPAVVSFPNPQYILLDGSTNIVQVPDDANAAGLTNLGTQLTVAAWIRRDRLNGGIDTIYVNGETAPGFWHMGIMSDHSLAFRLSTTSIYSTTTTLADLNWHHVAATLTGGNLNLYIDGNADASFPGVAVPAATAGDKFIGSRASAGARFPGNIDELRIYNRALPLAEIKRLAQGRGCPTNGSSWGTAFPDLQCALDEALPGEDIWIANGDYRPGVNRFVSFDIPDSVDLLGGFNGNETSLGQRPAHNPMAPLTKLSGDLLINDLFPAFTNHGDNSYHVMRIAAGVDTALNRLGVAGGNANKTTAPPEDNGGGLKIEPGAGSLYLDEVSFSSNRAQSRGGAIHSQSPMTLNQVHAGYNLAVSDGGGIYTTTPLTINGGQYYNNQAQTFYGGALNVQHTLLASNAGFTANLAAFGGGAIFSSSQPITITASTFMTNTTTVFYGGAIEASGRLFVGSSTFQGNQASFGGGAVHTSGDLAVVTTNFTNNKANGANCSPVCTHGFGGAIHAQGSLSISQGAYTGNTARLDGGAIHAAGPTATITSIQVTGNKAGFPSNTGNPNLGDGGGIYSTAPLLVDSSVFNQNQAKVEGGGIKSEAALTLSGSALNQNVAVLGGALYLANGGSLDNSGSASNQAASKGGGIYLQAGALTLIGSVFASNFIQGGAGDGGGIYMQGGTLNSTGTNLTFNQAANGGGLYVEAGSVDLSGATISKNGAAAGGGGIYNLNGVLELQSSSLVTNTAVTNGGGILNSGVLTDTNGIYRNNDANASGGGVYIGSFNAIPGTGSFTGSAFRINRAATDGGGLFSIADLTLHGTTVFSNTAETGRGGGAFVASQAIVSGGLFDKNKAINDGGGLFVLNGPTTITGATFSNNLAQGGANSDGGGIYTSAGATALANSALINNQAGRLGGGGALANAVVDRTTFQDNKAALEGGGLILLSGNHQVLAAVFRGNNSSLSGALAADAPAGCTNTLSVVNSLFFDNVASAGVGASDIRLFDMVFTLTNNTFGRSGSVLASARIFRCAASASNNIWAGYTNSLVIGPDPSPASISEDYNLLFNAPLGAGVTSGGHSLAGNPFFTNPGANLFTLQAASPAIDRGSNAALPPGLLTDLAGGPRLVNGVVDMGAYEAIKGIFLPFVRK